MLDGLISTKFHNPLTMGHLTARPHLDERLDESLQPGCRLALVTAPAGFGKSTLVSAWLRKQAVPFSWLSLDSSDNDPKQFLSYFVGALQMIDVSLGQSQVNRIQTINPGAIEAACLDVMTSLLNEIAALPVSFILVLDDCHLLKNPVLLQLINFLIERQPAQMRLFLLTREDLPLPVSRLRVRRQVIEIRQADLQFSLHEAEDFLHEGMGISGLTPQDVLALEQRTEGWIAGLQLAALSIRSDPDPANFIKNFAGSDRYILDYLLEEVFSHQPPEIQNFLLATSILDRFCAPLCDAVLGAMLDPAGGAVDHSLAMLEKLEHSNLFLIPLDYQRNWYRYHHLFGDLLRHTLGQAAPRRIPAMHLQASRWLEANGFIQESVKHAFQTQDWAYSAELVERHAWNEITHSRVSTASEWCRSFPDAVIRKYPSLCIFHAWALVIGFKKEDFPAAIVRIEQAEAALADILPEARASLVLGAAPVRLHDWVRGQVTLLRSFILMAQPRKQADPQALIDLGQLSYDQLPVEDIPARSAGLLDICYASQARCDAEDAEIKFENTVSLALSGGNFFGAMVGEYHRAHGLFTQGRLREVLAFCEQKRQAYEAYFEHPIQEMPAIALLDQAQGCALLELNERAEAERLLRRGLEIGQWMPREELPGYLYLARLCAEKGDSQDLAATLRRLEFRWPDIAYCTQAVRIVYDLKARPNDPAVRRTAAAWADIHRPEIGPGILVPGIGPAWNDEADYAVYTAWAQAQIILGKPAEALGVVEPMLKAALEHGLVHRVIGLSLLQAQAYYHQALKERAWKPLRLALTHAEASGYLSLFDQGPQLVPLLLDAVSQGIAPYYIQRLLSGSPVDSAHLGAPGSAAPSLLKLAPDGLVEPLSNREAEVLVLMAQGLSNADISTRLFISANTLKAHTQNIYTKLDVHSRVQALIKARELKLI